MKIKDLLSPRAIWLNAPAESKSQAIDALVELHAAAGNLTDPSAYKAAILAREGQGTTAIGEGIAVPHAKSDSVAHAALAAMTVPGGVDYDAPDGKPSSLLFMIAAPPDGDVHLEILSRLMVMLMEPEFCDRLRGAKTAEEFIEIIDAQGAGEVPGGDPGGYGGNRTGGSERLSYFGGDRLPHRHCAYLYGCRGAGKGRRGHELPLKGGDQRLRRR